MKFLSWLKSLSVLKKIIAVLLSICLVGGATAGIVIGATNANKSNNSKDETEIEQDSGLSGDSTSDEGESVGGDTTPEDTGSGSTGDGVGTIPDTTPDDNTPDDTESGSTGDGVGTIPDTTPDDTPNVPDQPTVDVVGSEGVLYEIPDGADYAVAIGYQGSNHYIKIASKYQGKPVKIVKNFNQSYFLQSIVIPEGVTTIGNSAFYGCIRLKSVELPDSLTSIGVSAFEGCCDLMSIKIPNGVTEIKDFTFAECRNLDNVQLPNNLKSIGRAAFLECFIESVYLANTLASIGDFAFEGCKYLNNLVIPNNVTFIGESAISYCFSLTNIQFNGSISDWDSITKGDLWNDSTPATEVVCNDGRVAL